MVYLKADLNSVIRYLHKKEGRNVAFPSWFSVVSNQGLWYPVFRCNVVLLTNIKPVKFGCLRTLLANKSSFLEKKTKDSCSKRYFLHSKLYQNQPITRGCHSQKRQNKGISSAQGTQFVLHGNCFHMYSWYNQHLHSI